MKAIVTDNKHPENHNTMFGLRLVAEGANDFVLLRLLAREYPAIVYAHSSDSAIVPIFEGYDDGLVTTIDISWPPEDTGPIDSLRLMTTYDPRGGTIRHGTLVPHEGSDGVVKGLSINGRDQVQCADGSFEMEDIVAGARLELLITPVRDKAGRWIKFGARIVPGMSPRTKAGLEELIKIGSTLTTPTK